MKDSPEISIIVAVYKAESYIRRCLDSIRAQTFSDFEVLLIDDGSPDRSGEICDKYAAIDTRFRVFHKENGGVSSARQCGVDNARGKYSIHVDPDDWVEPDYLEVLYNKITEEDADMCCCNYIEEYGIKSIIKGIQKKRKKSFILNQVDSFGWSMCNRLVLHELYSKYNIHFPNGLDIGEDVLVIRMLLSHNLKIVTTDRYLYHYDRIINSNSLTNKNNPYRFKLDEYCLETLYRMESTESVVHQRKYQVGNMANNVFLYNIMTHVEFVRYFRKYFFDIMTSSNPIWRKINIILMFMGLGNIVRPMYLKLKRLYLNR